jgi:Bacterial archaeo-eukaryotic release factor family 3
MHSLTVDFKSGVLSSRAGPCLSLYQPTHRHHPENQQDPVRFRNLTRVLAESLEQRHGSPDATALLEPFHALARDGGFWKHTQSGVAVLAAPGFFRVYPLLRTVPERAVVAESFHVKPLLRIVQSADAYHVLTLNRREMRLFEGNRDALEEIDVVPGARTITEALGDQLTEPHLTVAAYGGAGGVAQRHGHGSKNDEVDVDTERYFRAVDRSILQQYSRPSGLPLILAALSEYHAPFHSVSQNPYLLTEGIEINPSALSSDELCRRAWRAVEPRYLARLGQLVERFGAARGVNRGGENLRDIASAAVAGRVATILIEADRVVPGRIVRESGGITFGSLDRPDTDDVLDDLGELVLGMGGEVVVVPVDRMPVDTGAAAIYRF